MPAASRTSWLGLLVCLSVVLTSGAAIAAPLPFDCAPEDFVREVQASMRLPHGSRRIWSGHGPEIEATPRFLLVYDRELRLYAPPWSSPQAYSRAFELAEDAWSRSQGDGIKALLVFTAFDTGRGDLFYLPVANDVLGLGAGLAATVFDERPASSLDGLIFLGEPRQLIAAGEAYFREAFLHELAHRWLAYADIAHPQLEPNALRGRQGAHWNYFSSTGSSPMEGNDWEETSAGVFRTRVPEARTLRFSELDLYLMGLLPLHEVPPLRLLRPIEVLSPPGLALSASSPPARRNGIEVTVRAETIELNIDTVLQGSGPRSPELQPNSLPVRWPIGIVVLSRGRTLSPLNRAALADLESRLEQLVLDFQEATGGRMQLSLEVMGAGTNPLFTTCESVLECDLAQSEVCESLSTSRRFCTRACTADTECGEGVCCPGFRLCVPIGACSQLTAPDQDAGPAGSNGDAGSSGPDSSEDPASSCQSGPQSGSAAFWSLLLLFRLARRRRESPGSPEAARTQRRRDRASLGAS